MTSVVCIAIVLGSGFIAYSRFVWLVYFVAVFAAMIVERSWRMMALTSCAVLVIVTSFYDVFNTIFEARFLSSEAEISDIGRIEEARALISEIKVRPILGKGMGTYANTNVSSGVNMYSYELQWLAFLMQFGIVGEIGILLLVAASARDLVVARHPARPWMFVLFLLWLLASWTNPYLTSSFAGATFGLFMAMFYRMRTMTLNGESSSISLVPSLQPR
jgi:hypothetical protein